MLEYLYVRLAVSVGNTNLNNTAFWQIILKKKKKRTKTIFIEDEMILVKETLY